MKPEIRTNESQSILDPEAYGLLYQQYQERIFSLILRRTGNIQDAEDLTSETFLQGLSYFNQFENQGVKPINRLQRIARDQVNMFYREKERHSQEILVFLNPASLRDCADPAEEVIKKEGVKAFFQAVTTLPTPQEQVVYYRAFTSLGQQQIAEKMNKSEGAIKQLFLRARRNLTRVIGKNT